MGENLVIALQITAIGMALVFGAILLFWGLMAVLVRLTADRVAAQAPAAPAAEPAAPDVDADRALKRRAAAVAVAAALALRDTAEPGAFPLPATALVSAWQAVMRAATLRQRGPLRRG